MYITNKVAAGFVNSCDTTGAIENDGPFCDSVPMKLSIRVRGETKFSSSKILGFSWTTRQSCKNGYDTNKVQQWTHRSAGP